MKLFLHKTKCVPVSGNKQSSRDTYIPLSKHERKNVVMNNHGYILLITMIFLIMLTVLAITGVSLNTTQTRIAANATDSEITLEKTEGALNEAVNNLMNGTYSANSFLKNSNGLYLLDPNNPPLWTTVNWSSSSSVISSFQGYSNSQAGYIIEQLPSIIQPGQNIKSPTYVYRITARSLGASGNTSVMLQSTVQIQQ
ncbi:pilus assembly protein [Fluoribacter dumoffii]|uniref:pilus assembly PilX family protein n=1 Tax=Fluoribacter dumoffii TaxID=463 RepID=UPI002244CF1A|nr:pilus assembly protein [Fluoribacter dumoffii]MCW8386399.1 pilus assembly protein [Fluoribacter dumoffii]MCW8419452.1 pilus assembly protein [Fluoribacter dumoffii]MCW8452673.1 pilus assembly protein [Fluoribacter dumoffii]MCW8460077.1 pilus assembly protein [Fluoribacter dumoffii]MCW8483555.1 pilus assembly protein [Fluoribacter dumoffii]